MSQNILEQVRTYQMSGLAFLENLNVFVHEANTKFKDFDNLEANLGSTVSFDLPPRFTTTDSLVADFQGAEQRVATLTADNPATTSFAFSSQQFIFNAEEYMEKFGESAVKELGSKVEIDVATVAETDTFRFFGDGIVPIDSSTQLAQALAFYREFGSAQHDTKGILPNLDVPAIIGSNLNQFALDRNNDEAQSWRLGHFDQTEWFQSNLLPLHLSGSVGNGALTLTVTGTTTAPDGSITAITFSGAGGAADAIKENDLLVFQDGVPTSTTRPRFLTFIGHTVSGVPIQLRATADAASVADSVTISIEPALFPPSVSGKNANTNIEITAGLTVKSIPDHRCGLIYGGDALFLAMPRLPEEHPYASVSETDGDTGVSLRLTHGAIFGQNTIGNIYSVLWGKTLIPEYAMRLVFPV